MAHHIGPYVPDVAWLKRHAWLTGADLDVERAQAEDEGRDLKSVRRAWERLSAIREQDRDAMWIQAVLAWTDRVGRLPIRADYPFEEPDEWEAIRAARPPGLRLPRWKGTKQEWLRRLYGGLLGRTSGCMLGKPVEGWMRESIRITAQETGNWPIEDYFRMPTAREQRRIAARHPTSFFASQSSYRRRCLRGFMQGAVEDDDLNYTVMGFLVVRQFGATFTAQDVAHLWCERLPILATCTAERVAYRNLVAGFPPPLSATYRNPYREWIGAQIRADFYGYANPGRPERAAEWAWRDAAVSHVRNGRYGAMWVAAMLAAAYVESDWQRIIRAGLAQVPVASRLRQAIEEILAGREAGRTWEDTVESIHQRWNERNQHHWCHTLSNAQAVAAALLYGNDDFTRTVGYAVMAGFDTDCNAATVGSLWGVRHGAEAIPAWWTKPLQDTLRTQVSGYNEVSLRACAEEMIAAAARYA